MIYRQIGEVPAHMYHAVFQAEKLVKRRSALETLFSYSTAATEKSVAYRHFEALNQGATVNAAAHSADARVQLAWSGFITTTSWYIAGSETQTLK